MFGIRNIRVSNHFSDLFAPTPTAGRGHIKGTWIGSHINSLLTATTIACAPLSLRNAQQTVWLSLRDGRACTLRCEGHARTSHGLQPRCSMVPVFWPDELFTRHFSTNPPRSQQDGPWWQILRHFSSAAKYTSEPTQLQNLEVCTLLDVGVKVAVLSIVARSMAYEPPILSPLEQSPSKLKYTSSGTEQTPPYFSMVTFRYQQ